MGKAGFAPLIVLFGTMAVVSDQAAAHPHVAIDYKIDVQFNAAGEATGLFETWVFDPFYSAALVGDLGGRNWSTVGLDLLGRMASQEFFTNVTANAAPVSFGSPTLKLMDQFGPHVALTFELPFSRPVAINGLQYQIYDPSYYIQMLHAGVSDRVTLQGAPAGCAAVVIEPQPSAAALMQAYLMDVRAEPGDGPGRHFAETVTIQCGTS